MSKRPQPIDKEADWDKSRILMSKTDLTGNIVYCNANFINVAAYDEEELIGKPHNMIRHPDTPSIIFKLLWDNLKQGKNFNAVVKNLNKKGEYYWVMNDIDFVRDTSQNITHYSGIRKAYPTEVIKEHIEPLYSKLRDLEASEGIEASEKYLNQFLAEKGKPYNEYVKELIA